MKKLIYLLLGLLGFTACEESEMCEYGTPTVDFTVKGRVTDKTGNPIKGIAVESEHKWTSTGRDGRFYISGIRECTDAIYFRDGDGEANGGEFAELRKVLPPESGEIDLGDVEMERVE
jgi:putative lipoprotein (rSAM/lipoprotein system)